MMKKVIVLMVFMLNISSLYICGAEDSSSSSAGPPYNCPVCHKSFTQRNNCTTHIDEQHTHTRATYHCPHPSCNHFSKRYSNLRGHYNSPSNNAAHPNKTIKTLGTLRLLSPEIRALIVQNPPKKQCSSNKIYRCPDCPKVYTKYHNLKTHSFSVHDRELGFLTDMRVQNPSLYDYIRGPSDDNPEATEVETDPDGDAEMKDAISQQQSASSSSSSSLSQSSSSAPSSATEKTLICPFSDCGQDFYSFARLREHTKTCHDGYAFDSNSEYGGVSLRPPQ